MTVTVILIVILLHSTATVTAIEFDGLEACQHAAAAIKQLVQAHTVCVPKL